MPLFSFSIWANSIALAVLFCLNFLFTHQTLSQNPCNDPYKVLNLTLNPDGTITRLHDPKSPPSPDPSLPVLSKDLIINQSKPTWARIYLPRKALDHTSKLLLPLFVFFHAGGFVSLSAASTTLTGPASTPTRPSPS